MKVCGLTGGVGMGKSAAAELLRKRGMSVVDTDVLAHDIVKPGQPALEEIKKEFGPEILGDDGHLRRDKLAGIVFADSPARARLEAIMHPRIAALWHEQIEVWRNEGKSQAVVVIPLLYETAAEKEFDAVICVACSPKTQQQRLLERGWSSEEIVRRNAAQLPIEQKMARSHFVIWNEAGLDVLAEQCRKILSPA